MCLFFFISAYFTPSSCDRKGARAFLLDKVKRLGLPFLAYVLGFGPLLDWLMRVELNGQPVDAYHYAPDPGQCWFLFWLLLFNVGYLLCGAPEEPFVVALAPSLTRLCALGAALGALNGALMLGTSNVVTMPITFGSLPLDVLFFVGGCLAKVGSRDDVSHKDLSSKATHSESLPRAS